MASAIRVEELGGTARGGGGIREPGLERERGGGDKRKVGRRRGQRRRFKRGPYRPPTAEIWVGGSRGGSTLPPWNLERDERWKNASFECVWNGEIVQV